MTVLLVKFGKYRFIPTSVYRVHQAITSRQEGITDNVDKFGFTMVDSATNDIITYQKGVFRTNCLDW